MSPSMPSRYLVRASGVCASAAISSPNRRRATGVRSSCATALTISRCTANKR